MTGLLEWSAMDNWKWQMGSEGTVRTVDIDN